MKCWNQFFFLIRKKIYAVAHACQNDSWIFLSVDLTSRYAYAKIQIDLIPPQN